MRPSALWRLFPLYLGAAVTGLSVILSIPVMIQAGGLDEWAFIGVGQAVGGLAAAFVSYGWGITGPTDIARMNVRQRKREYSESFKTRLALLPIAILAGAIITFSVTGVQGIWLGILGLMSTCLFGFSTAFFFLGTGELWKAFLYDSLPRASLTIVGTVLVAIGGLGLPGFAIPIFTSAGILIAACSSGFAILGGWRDHDPDRLTRRPLKTVLIARRHGLTTSVATGAFQVIPTLIVGWLAPGSLSVFVFYDKVFKQAMTFVSPIVNFLQGWVPRAQASEVETRLRVSIFAGLIGGGLCVGVVASLGGQIVELLSSGEVRYDGWSLVLLGLLIGSSLVDLVVSRIGLVVQSKMQSLAIASSAGFIVGVVGVGAFAPMLGVNGALLGTCLGTFSRLTFATIALLRK